jgi:hypothetical protein
VHTKTEFLLGNQQDVGAVNRRKEWMRSGTGRRKSRASRLTKRVEKKLEEGGSEEEFVFWNTTPDVDLICPLENRRKTGRGVAVNPSINVRRRTQPHQKEKYIKTTGVSSVLLN